MGGFDRYIEVKNVVNAPWKLGDNPRGVYHILDRRGFTVATAIELKDARFIIRAVNQLAHGLAQTNRQSATKTEKQGETKALPTEE